MADLKFDAKDITISPRSNYLIDVEVETDYLNEVLDGMTACQIYDNISEEKAKELYDLLKYDHDEK